MEFKPTKFKDAWLIIPKVFQDERGFFLETFFQSTFVRHGITRAFVQDNHSFSKSAGILRGLHFQLPPFTQAKLVRVTAGKVFDVIVDLRKDSETFCQWESFELSAENFNMLYIPRGFAHGFLTLEPHTEFLYKVDNPYAPEYDSGIIWNDPTLHIDWPMSDAILSDKDAALEPLSGREFPFTMSNS
ncbi:MAG: dTDP-4-dehydrorhamnose 3,5-epimerase [Candidatus Kerfeldbacteria bacterium]|nr:dTDP-4-dehydrorhamnose 3,5-epimerase [Candidatus Kerfeldbacteria bacterium]